MGLAEGGTNGGGTRSGQCQVGGTERDMGFNSILFSCNNETNDLIWGLSFLVPFTFGVHFLGLWKREVKVIMCVYM